MLVPRGALARQDDGSYHLILDAAAFERGSENSGVRESPLVAVIEETLAVHTTPLETSRVRIRKVVHEWEERVDAHAPQWVTLRREEAVVERTNPERDESNPCT